MEMTSRMKQIMQVLLQESGAVSVKYLAEQIGVSRRTVQRELESIDTSLRGYDLTFVSKTGVGIRIEGSEEEKSRLLAVCASGDDYDVSNREERRKRLILEILKEKGLRKLYYYSSKFAVSEATVSADLEAVEGWLARYGLFVGRKPGSGISIEGSEENYRRAIRGFIDENIDTKIMQEVYGVDGYDFSSYQILKKSSIGQILNDDIVSRVIDIVSRFGHNKVLTLTENSYVGLIIHISIAINRIKKNEVIEDDENWKQDLSRDEDYELAKSIVEELEREFAISIPQVEISYICLHLKGAKHEKIQWDSGQKQILENRELQQLVNDMIDAYDTKQAYLMKQDDGFIQGLLAHLQPTLIRLVYGMQIQNPVLEDIKVSYPDIYRRCENVAKVLKAYTGKEVPEQEIGFLTVHFGAAMVRLEGRQQKIRKVSAGVICSSGIGISRLMSSKLERLFHGRMQLTAYGKHDITPYVMSRTDFFISTIPLEQSDIPMVFVNPLLNEEDIEHIRHMVHKYEQLPKKQNEADEFSMQLEEVNFVASQINTVIKYMDFFRVDNQISFGELLIAIGEKMSPYSDCQEIIREDILRREQIASQVFAEFGFALFHARTKGVMRPAFSVCMTKDLEPFADAYFKGIQIVFIMLAPADDHVKINGDIMGYISSMLIEDYEFMDIVVKGDKEEIRSALSANLKKYFNKYIGGFS
ncbi:MAG: BglG family transcription antiterminator [Eubacterium sp.]|nr:BglG family transcription antiterminator [Eubacterium sp.]